MPEKKLIKFEDDQLEKVDKYAKENKTSFTQAVRILVEIGLKSDDTDNVEGEADAPDNRSNHFAINELEKRVLKLEQDQDWWNADDIQSRVGNLEVNEKETTQCLADLDKRINVLTKISKLFKAHIKNREIHLQD